MRLVFSVASLQLEPRIVLVVFADTRCLPFRLLAEWERIVTCASRIEGQLLLFLRFNFESTTTMSLFRIIKPLTSSNQLMSLVKGPLMSISVRQFALAPELKAQFDKMVKQDKVVVFMKGVPEAPRCGFSNAVVQILRMHGVSFAAYDVLADEQLRQGVKEYSEWPTIPQVYIGSQFVGGCDILLQMHRSQELIDTLKAAGIESALAGAAQK